MKRVARVVLSAAVVVAFGVVTAPSASANDCSNPKNPCGGCSVNLQATDIRNLVECHPV